MKTIYKCLCVCAFLPALATCKDDRWDEHAKITGELGGVSLKEAIQAEAECSAFYEALVSTGYDTLLASANNFTVFVPSNSAWQQAQGKSSVEELRAAVANHIAYDKLLSTNPDFFANPLRMLSGKMVRYDDLTKTFNGAAITAKDRVVANGVFHLTDVALERRDNVWDYIYSLRSADYPQVQFLKSVTVNHREMDMGKSIQVGLNAMGQPVYDTAWVDVNDFLRAFPINGEAKEWTYVVLRREGFEQLYLKYRPYFAQPSTQRTDSLTSINICRDFVFEGRIDITQHDTITNADGVKVPVMRGAGIVSSYEASNGRVYIINGSNILLREKIKPVLIEGESYNPARAADPSFIFTRYKRWANGDRDVMLAGRVSQTDTIHVAGSLGQDSTYTVKKTFLPESQDGNKPNVYNSYIEYKAPVYAVSYEIHYVAYDDIAAHSSVPLQTLRIEQKLFVSMPGRPVLQKGTQHSADAVANNHMTARGSDVALYDTCFVALDTAGVYRERKMRKWTVSRQKAQAIQAPVTTPQAYTMSVPAAGELTMWLCNTARDKDYASQLQGLLFLDYIKLVPILKEN
jgi:uncharacterized surface protein with fasciclin (FAS1) repeats